MPYFGALCRHDQLALILINVSTVGNQKKSFIGVFPKFTDLQPFL